MYGQMMLLLIWAKKALIMWLLQCFNDSNRGKITRKIFSFQLWFSRHILTNRLSFRYFSFSFTLKQPAFQSLSKSYAVPFVRYSIYMLFPPYAIPSIWYFIHLVVHPFAIPFIHHPILFPTNSVAISFFRHSDTQPLIAQHQYHHHIHCNGCIALYMVEIYGWARITPMI